MFFNIKKNIKWILIIIGFLLYLQTQRYYFIREETCVSRYDKITGNIKYHYPQYSEWTNEQLTVQQRIDRNKRLLK